MNAAKFRDLTKHPWLMRYLLAGVLVFVVVNVAMIYTYKFRCITYLSVFSRIIELPNSFVVDASKVNEVVLRRGGELITIGEFTDERKNNLIPYLQRGPHINGLGCGVSYLSSTPEGVNTVLLFKGGRYLIFWGVQKEVSENVVSRICDKWEFKKS